ncbi:hypothetical protein TB2_004487 [Malus domestica]|uniref:protein ALTERED PHOSPHATE STARVATION RESPONSE 1-like isoform X1 n=2 Tax=Malus domestica TaxID=3750 RepID=UPI0039766AFD
MGCVASRIDKEERVRVCKERKKLMKQLVRFRGEFAEAQLAYLRSLRNTGSTLRQFTESETLELDNTAPYGLESPASPPPSLPPPPPPPFSPDSRKLDDSHREEVGQEEYIERTEDDSSTPPPPPNLSSSSPEHHKHDETVELLEEEWEETKMEFEEDELEEETVANVVNSPPKNLQLAEAIVEDVSVKKRHTKDTADVPMGLWRSKKTLEGIAKELDDYFLKSSDGLKEIAVLMDIKGRDTFLPLSSSESQRKTSNSTKVFSAFPWSWSSRSLQFPKDAVESSGPNEPCRPGAHCITLKKLYDHEKKLYKEVKEEEYTKFEHDRKSKLLKKQEDGNNDWTKTEKIRLSVESLESEILRLHDSISTTCSSIVKLIDNELYPQLVTLTSGLLHLWRTMYECHRAQHYFSQQLNILTDIEKLDLSSNHHRQAAVQLETEVSCWYNSFGKVIKSQKEYVRTLSGWIQLTDSLVSDDRKSLYSSSVHRICEQWNLAFERLQDKEAAEAIKSLLLAIHSILMQQEEEHNLQKKYEKLDKRLQKESDSLVEMEERSTAEDLYSSLGPKHPLSLKRAKIEALKKQVDSERAKYLNSVQVSRAMTLENLKTRLPNVFQALMTSSNLYVEAIESVCGHIKPADGFDSTSEIALPSTS